MNRDALPEDQERVLIDSMGNLTNPGQTMRAEGNPDCTVQLSDSGANLTILNPSIPDAATLCPDTSIVDRAAENAVPSTEPGHTPIVSGAWGATKVPLRDCTKSFELQRPLGAGGQGEVFEAKDHTLGRRVAVKRASVSPLVRQHFFKEAFTAAQLDHPNIVPVYEIGVIQHEQTLAPMLAMKCVQGRTWEEIIEEDRSSLMNDEAFLHKHLSIFIPVLNALKYAHAKGIIHRDLKPSQVMVGSYGEVYLLDWGLAVMVEEMEVAPDSEPLIDPTRVFTKHSATNPAGTPAYMAPEQAQLTTAGLGVHTDIYLIGSTLYALVTGRPPHVGKTVRDVVLAARRNQILPPSESVPAEISHLIMRCLASRPEQRPKSVAEVQQAIENWLTGAGRKEESRVITRDFARQDLTANYDMLSTWGHKLSQAGNAWPENPDLPSCRERLLSTFVEAALSNQDFILAQLQADRVENPELSAQLQQKIDAGMEAARAALPQPPLFTIPRLAAMLASIALAVAAVVYVVRQAEVTVLREIHSKVQSIAALAAKDVRAEDLHAVDRNRNIMSPEFSRAYDTITEYRRANGDIRFIYTMRPEPNVEQGVWRTLVDADPMPLDINRDGTISGEEQGNPPGNIYDEGVPEMLDAFRERKVTSAALNDAWGSFISGFAPVVDLRTGEVVAILGVDIKTDLVNMKQREVRTAGTVAGVVLVALIAWSWLAYFTSRRALATVRLLEDALKKQNAEVRKRGIYLG